MSMHKNNSNPALSIAGALIYIIFLYFNISVFVFILTIILLAIVLYIKNYRHIKKDYEAFIHNNDGVLNIDNIQISKRSTKEGFEIYNKYVLLKYNKLEDKLYVVNLENTLQNFSISKFYDLKVREFKAIKNTEEVIINILGFADKDMKYSDILSLFENKKATIDSSEIDINNASEEEIAKLPGISVMDAKKTIKYRDEQGGFITKKEFYAIARIKGSYIKMIEDNITIGKYVHEKNMPYTEDREMDS